jgi:O-antigen/teichoic acid export membrane protein
VVSAALSKIPAIFVQVLMIPTILHRLGAGELAAFFSLTSLAAVASLVGTGMFPAISSALASAASRGDRARERQIVKDSSALFAAITVGFTLVAALVPITDIQWLTGVNNAAADRDFAYAYAAAAGTTALNLFATSLVSFRIGYQETHRVNLLAFWSNIFVLVAIAAASFFPASLAVYILVIFAPQSVAYIADFVLLCVRRRLLDPSGLRFGTGLKNLMRTSATTFVAQFAWYFNTQGSVVMVSHLAGVDATNRYSAVIRPMLISFGLFTMFVQPLVPSLSSAWALGDLLWVRDTYRRLRQGIAGLSLCVALGLVVCGPWVFRLWLRHDIGIDWALCAASGAYFVVWALEYMNYNVLLALQRIEGLATLFGVEVALAITGGVLLLPKLGATGMMLVLLAATLAVNTWALPRKIAATMSNAPD